MQNAEFISNTTCITQIMQSRDALCDLEDIGDIRLITEPEPNYILLINSNNTIVTTNCNEERYELSGTALLHYNKCTVNINGRSYKDKLMIHKDDLPVPLITNSKINQRILIDKLNLNKLRKYQMEDYKSTSKKTTITIVIICILSIAFTVLIIYTSKKTRITYVPNNLFNVSAPTISSLWPSLYSKGEELQHPQ